MEVIVAVQSGLAKSPELELELIQTQMAQKPMLRAEVGMRETQKYRAMDLI
jgi:hypothetical protein